MPQRKNMTENAMMAGYMPSIFTTGLTVMLPLPLSSYKSLHRTKSKHILEHPHHHFAAPECSTSYSSIDSELSIDRQLYQYKSLKKADEIRLLVLAPGTHPEQICCSLKHFSLSKSPNFEALSYAWGNVSLSWEILCSNKRIPVTESASIALHHLRHKDRERILWIDAICINQGSVAEKSQQVALMGEIYSRARRTIVWLGEDRGSAADLAFEYITRIDTCLVGEHQTEQELRQRIAHEYEISEGMVGDWALNFVDAIAPVFEQTWFTRLWIVQEVALSVDAQLIFGNQSVSMSVFMRVMVYMSAFQELNYHQQRFAFHSLGNLINIGVIQSRIAQEQREASNKQPFNVLELLRCTERFECSDPRDRIYALLGIMKTSGFSIDYSLSTERTFMKFALWALRAFPDLALMSYARGVTLSEWNLPSWVPSPHMDGLPLSLLNVSHYQASGRVFGPEECEGPNDICPINETGELCLRVKIVDRVLKLAKGALNAAVPEELRSAMLESEHVAQCCTRSLDDERYQRFCAAMTLETTIDNTKASPQQAESFHDHFIAIQSRDRSDKEYHPRNAVQDLQGNWARHRSFCRTKEDRFAFVAWRAESGDEICIIRGARIPYVIRRQQDGKFMLVGECWIQGLMEGEVITASDAWEEICLK